MVAAALPRRRRLRRLLLCFSSVISILLFSSSSAAGTAIVMELPAELPAVESAPAAPVRRTILAAQSSSSELTQSVDDFLRFAGFFPVFRAEPEEGGSGGGEV